MYALVILRSTASGVSVESSNVFLSDTEMRPVGTFSPLPSGPVALTGPPGPVTPGPVPVPTRGSPLPRVPRPLRQRLAVVAVQVEHVGAVARAGHHLGAARLRRRFDADDVGAEIGELLDAGGA